MLTCPQCQFTNPADHKFCQRCGEPLFVTASAELPEPAAQSFQARLMPPDQLGLSPATYLDSHQRYQVITVLSQGSALISDMTPEVRSPLQEKLPDLANMPVDSLQTQVKLPPAAYPYLLLPQAAPTLYDAWQQDETTLLITPTEQRILTSLVDAFSAAIDPLQHVYWMYTLTDVWATLAPIPQWRSSLLLANNLGIDAEQSLRIRRFIPPAQAPHSEFPDLSELKAFLQSLLALPHRGTIAPRQHIRQIVLAVTSAQTLEQLRCELAAIGESLLATPEAITPAVTSQPEEANLTATSFTASSPAASATATTTNLEMLPSVPNENPMNTSAESTLNTPLSPPLESPLEAIELDTLDFSEPIDDNDEVTMVLPMKLLSVESVGRTDVGRQRDHNEDCFFIASNTHKRASNSNEHTQAHCLYVLCDGMGGHDGGEVASQLAAQTLSTYFEEHWPTPLPGSPPSSLPSEATLIEAVKLANQAIYDINETEARAGHARMGTTLIVVLLQGTEAVVAHVGDSRLYQYTRRLGLKQITTDHEVGQREIKRGVPHDIAYARPDAYQLTQALGPRASEALRPSVSSLNFSEDALLLLCSDGLSDNNLIEDHLISHIDPLLRGKKDLARGLDELITLGNEVNGHDNISAIAIRLQISPDMDKTRNRNHSNPGQTRLQ